MIKANNLTMIYGGDFKSVDNLTFNVKKGEILGFVGPNGAGKTTVIKINSLLYTHCFTQSLLLNSISYHKL